MHRLRRVIDNHPLGEDIWRLYDWLMCPLTLWALDYLGVARHAVEVLRQGKEFDADFMLLLRLIDEVPRENTRMRMQEHEKGVAAGKYDGLAKGPERFQEIESACVADPLLRKFWNRLKSRYAAQFRPNDRGVIRRTLAQERGFNPRHEFRWAKKRDRFQITFDALCYRWCLYGFEGDEPLALKLTANATPHGTMIFVPRLMSLDGTRTIVWRAINEIHRAHGAPRQGTKLSLGRMQRRIDREAARAFDAEAREKGLRGMKRYQFILVRMRQLPRRIGWVRRLLGSERQGSSKQL